MAIITGTRERSDVTGERRVYDVDKEILMVQPEMASLVVLLSKLRSEVSKDPKFFWYDKDLVNRWDAINLAAGYLSTDTSIVVDHGSYFRANDIVLVPRTKERFIVESVATNTLTIARSWGSTAAAALVDDDPLVIIGSVNEEGAVSRTIKTQSESESYNYLQIVRTPFGTTKTAQASESLGAKDREELRRTELVTHRLDIERTIFFGERNEDTSGTQAKRSTGGLLEWLTYNNKDFGVIPTEDEMESWCEDLFKYGSKTKLLVCSPGWITYINRWGRDKLQIVDKASSYGINITRYMTAHGELLLTRSYVLEGAIFGKYAFALDMKYLTLKYLAGRKHILNTNIQLPDADEYKDEYLSELGMKVQMLQAHGVAYYNV